MKTTTTIRERIAVRAYLMWEKHYQAGVVNALLPGNDLGYWLAAESIELGLAADRAVSAKKADDTRKLNVAKAPVAAVIAARRRPAASRAIH